MPKLPLNTVYQFAEKHGGELWEQVQKVKQNRQLSVYTPSESNQSSTLRRGLIIELFQQHGVLNEFVHDAWSPSENPDEELDRCRKLLAKSREKHGPVVL